MKFMTTRAWLERYFDAESHPDTQKLQRWLREGKIPGRKVGGTWYVDEHAWLAGGDELVARVLADMA